MNFDPDAPGANAAERSISLLLEESMHVRIMELDGDLDPDEYCKSAAPTPTGNGWKRPRVTSTGWRTARERSMMFTQAKGSCQCLQFLLPAVQRISEPLGTHRRSPTTWPAISGWTAAWCWTVFAKRSRTARRRRWSVRRRALRPDERMLLNALLADPEIQDEVIEALEAYGGHRSVRLAAHFSGDVSRCTNPASASDSRKYTRVSGRAIRIFWPRQCLTKTSTHRAKR